MGLLIPVLLSCAIVSVTEVKPLQARSLGSHESDIAVGGFSRDDNETDTGDEERGCTDFLMMLIKTLFRRLPAIPPAEVKSVEQLQREDIDYAQTEAMKAIDVLQNDPRTRNKRLDEIFSQLTSAWWYSKSTLSSFVDSPEYEAMFNIVDSANKHPAHSGLIGVVDVLASNFSPNDLKEIAIGALARRKITSKQLGMAIGAKLSGGKSKGGVQEHSNADLPGNVEQQREAKLADCDDWVLKSIDLVDTSKIPISRPDTVV